MCIIINELPNVLLSAKIENRSINAVNFLNVFVKVQGRFLWRQNPKNFKEGIKTNSYLFFQLQCDRPNNNWQNEVYTYKPILFRMRMYDVIFDGLIFDKTAIDL